MLTLTGILSLNCMSPVVSTVSPAEIPESTSIIVAVRVPVTTGTREALPFFTTQIFFFVHLGHYGFRWHLDSILAFHR